MKYYAVTDDPNELLHYGVKGMKWGEHLFGTDGRRSPGYKRALGKLRSSVQKATSAIKKNNFQRQMDKQKKQQEKYNNAVKNIQRRIKIAEGLNRTNNIRSLEKSMAREMRIQQKRAKIAAKREAIAQRNELAADKTDLKYFKNEAKMNKFIQKARKGTLKYGKLSDDQVRQITDRLTMEQNARRLGSAEKTWRQQKKEAFRKGKLSGIERGTAAAMEEVARAGAVYGIQNFMNRRKLNNAAEQEGKRMHIKDRAKNKRTHKEVREDLRNEMYEEAVKSGEGILARRSRLTTAGAAKKLEEIRNKNLIADERNKQWRDYLIEAGLTEKQALKLHKGKTKGQIVADKAEFDKQQESIRNAAAYKKVADQAEAESKHKRNVEAQEKENARLKEDYNNDMEQYRKDKEHDAKVKEQYDRDVEKYNKDMADYNKAVAEYTKANNVYQNRKTYDVTAKAPTPPGPPPRKPSNPTYRNPQQPKKPTYHDIDYNPPAALMPSYEDYMRLRDIGLNPYSNNNGGNGKKKPKK